MLFPGTPVNGTIQTDNPCTASSGLLIDGSLAGKIVWPGYPTESYPNNSNCTWVLEVENGFNIKLTILEFDLEEGYDLYSTKSQM